MVVTKFRLKYSSVHSEYDKCIVNYEVYGEYDQNERTSLGLSILMDETLKEYSHT